MVATPSGAQGSPDILCKGRKVTINSLWLQTLPGCICNPRSLWGNDFQRKMASFYAFTPADFLRGILLSEFSEDYFRPAPVSHSGLWKCCMAQLRRPLQGARKCLFILCGYRLFPGVFVTTDPYGTTIFRGKMASFPAFPPADFLRGHFSE